MNTHSSGDGWWQTQPAAVILRRGRIGVLSLCLCVAAALSPSWGKPMPVRAPPGELVISLSLQSKLGTLADGLRHELILCLGGVMGAMAVLTKQELLLPIVGGLFVIEALSVIIQVTSYKLTGKRVFRMAPLHHHFELLGWSETRVTIRFWIIAFVFALMSLSTFKLR